MDQSFFNGVAVAPDGNVYVTVDQGVPPEPRDIFVGIVGGVEVAGSPRAVAVTPDGKHLYATSGCSFLLCGDPIVWVINTAAKTVAATIPVGDYSNAIAITPDGTRAYVPTSGAVSVINTATNKVVATIPVGGSGVAITPDGNRAYVTNSDSNNVSVIDTGKNTVAATVPVGGFLLGIAIMPPPPAVPFVAFNAKLQIDIDRDPKKDAFALESSFTLSSTASNGIHPHTEPVTLRIGTFSIIIPSSFRPAPSKSTSTRTTRTRSNTSMSMRTDFSPCTG